MMATTNLVNLAEKLEEELHKRSISDSKKIQMLQKIDEKEFKLGFPIDCRIEAYTNPVIDENGKELRGSQAAFHLDVIRNYGLQEYEDRYRCFIKEISRDNFEEGAEVLGVIRNIKEENDVVYIEQRVERGDEFVVRVKERGRQKGDYFAVFLSYNVFITAENARARGGIEEITIGSHYRIRAETIREKIFEMGRSVIQGIAVEMLTKEEYSRSREIIARNKKAE